MTAVRLVAEPRDSFGKGAARRTRRAGQVPAVVYGAGIGLTHISLNGHDLAQALRKPGVVFEIEIGGEVLLTAPRDVQRDPVRRVLEHVDLVVIDAAEAADRGARADAIADAMEAAEAAGLDATAVGNATAAAFDAGESAEDAIAHAVHDVEAAGEANSEANDAAAAAEDAATAASGTDA